MRLFLAATILAVATLVSYSAFATPIGVDGIRSPGEYGSPTATVTYDPNAPNSNFGAPGSTSKYVGYDIYLRTDGAYLYGLLQARPDKGGKSVGPFANIYLSLGAANANANGYDLGFETENADAFIPGNHSSVKTPETAFAFSADQNTVEFAIPYIDLTGPIAELSYYPGTTFPGLGDSVTLRASQAFGYSVNGGPTYGANSLGSVTLVPEPVSATLLGTALLALGFLRRRSSLGTG